MCKRCLLYAVIMKKIFYEKPTTNPRSRTKKMLVTRMEIKKIEIFFYFVQVAVRDEVN